MGNLLYREFPSFLLSKIFRFILEPSIITPYSLAVHYQPFGVSRDLFIHPFIPSFIWFSLFEGKGCIILYNIYKSKVKVLRDRPRWP
jgi:hypothetical protein